MRAEFIKYVLNYVIGILKRYMEKFNARWKKTKITIINFYYYVIVREIVLILNNELDNEVELNNEIEKIYIWYNNF